MTHTSTPILIFTGGHHTSALALATALRSRGWDIVWIGHRKSLWRDSSDSAEFREVTGENIPFFDLKAGKMYGITNPFRLLRVPWGLIQALLLLMRLKITFRSRIKGIVTFGGYLGVPVAISGWLTGIPIISHEQTVSAGWANKLIAVFAQKIAISWASSSSHYPANKVVLTGLPLRPEVVHTKKLSLPKRQNLLYVTCGKQGSHIINQCLFEILPELVKDYQIVHQTGSSTLFNDNKTALNLKNGLSRRFQSKYHVFDYLSADQAALHLATARLVISRSGAHIVQELAYFHTAAVLIPIPNSSHNEQLSNAQILALANQAVILPQDSLSPTTLKSAINKALQLAPGKISVIEDGLENMVQLVEKTFSQKS